MEYSSWQRHTLWLYAFVCPALDKYAKLTAALGSPDEIFEEPPEELAKYVGAERLGQMRAQNDENTIDRMLEKLDSRGITFVCRGDNEYPQIFEDIAEYVLPPELIFVRGQRDIAAAAERSVAMVGTRSSSPDGERIATRFARDFAEAGVTVISGMAVGIDGASISGALDGGGRTMGVLGCGVDVPYPAQNQKLVARMLEAGGSLISEYMPGTKALPANFLTRNRLIAAMACGTLIVQAPRRSGALNTATHALESGRDVFVVPGSILDAKFAGSNELLRDGAMPALCSRDVLEPLGLAPLEEGKPVQDMTAARRSAPQKPQVALTDDELTVSNLLRKREHSFDEMIAATEFDTARLNSLLTMLKIKGIIYETAGKHYRIKES